MTLLWWKKPADIKPVVRTVADIIANDALPTLPGFPLFGARPRGVLVRRAVPTSQPSGDFTSLGVSYEPRWQLIEPISAVATTLILSAPLEDDMEHGQLVVDGEIMGYRWAGGGEGYVYGLVRGRDGTTAVAHDAGSAVQWMLPSFARLR